MVCLVFLSLLFTVFLAQNGSSALKFECPPQGVPDPCECLEMFGNIFFKCSNLQNIQQLMGSIQAMSGYGMTKFEITGSKVPHLPYDIFSNSSVFRISVKNTAMFHFLDRKLVSGYTNLSEISLDTVTFEGGLNWSVMENLPQLWSFTASKCNLRKVDDVLNFSVESLLLPFNDIEYLHPLVFSNLKSLKNLQLAHNSLQEVKRSMFPKLSSLNFLDLSHNRLSTLPPDIFDGMKDLNSLILRGNIFNVLEKTYMENVFPVLAFFDVDDNPLKCGCELSWVLSESKPYHFFGLCSSEEDVNARYLSDLLADDFKEC